MEALFLRILNMSIAAGWLILAVAAVRLLMKKAPGWVCCLLWLMVAVRLLCPVSLESVWSLIPSGETVSPEIVYSPAPSINSGVPVINSAVNSVLRHSFAPDPAASANPMQVWLSAAAVVWILGMDVMFVYALASYWRLRRRVRAAVPAGSGFWVCDGIGSPFILGVIRPRIYLPSVLAEGIAAHVLAHERAHLKRRDHWWKPLGFILLSVYWFHPLSWLAYLLFCRDIELACDEKVVREYSLEKKKAYSGALLACSVSRRTIAACPLAFGETDVKERVKKVLYYKKPGFWAVVAAAVACVVVAVCFLTNPKRHHDTLRFRADAGAEMYGGWFDVDLGGEVKSGTLYAEQWYNGECTQSAPIGINRDTGELSLLCSIVKDETDGGWTGVDIQIGPSGINGDDLLTRFVLPGYLPDGTPGRGQGFSFTSLEEGKYVRVAPGENRILAAMAFDLGNGVESYSCEALEKEPERLESAEYLVVVRGVFSDEEVPAQREEAAGDDSLARGENPAERILTLEEIISLSEKGDSLSWTDFDGFSYTEAGSGLYIRIYETDSPFILRIGGGSPGAKPTYIYLQAPEMTTGQEADHIDIRDGDAENFIRSHGGLLLESAVRKVILEENRSDESWEYVCVESHEILVTKMQNTVKGRAADTITVYAMVLYQEYEVSEDGIREHAGSHMPVALTFAKDDKGRFSLAPDDIGRMEWDAQAPSSAQVSGGTGGSGMARYSLKEYWTPGDGSYYVSDIRKKFPGTSVSDALDTQKYILPQIQDCYGQAIEYTGMDPDSVIEGLFGEIMSAPDFSSSPEDYEEAQLLQMRELTYYGDYTLRYIFHQFSEGYQTGLKGRIMADIMRQMSGNEMMGVTAENGRQFFDTWVSKMQELDAENGREWMRENAPFALRCLEIMEELEQEEAERQGEV